MIKNSLATVKQNIRDACNANKRDASEVLLLAVSKRHSVKSIREAYTCGQTHFGENYLNEALEKQQQLADLPLVWHYIGSIQSNKTRKIAENFSWVHTVDSLKIAKRLSEQRPNTLPPLNICLQINIDNEESKSGITVQKDELLALAQEISVLPNIVLRGLMCIPAPKETSEQEIQTFQQMQVLQQYLKENGIALDTLSMGMSGDLENAIACGATIVRVGTAIFGARD